MEKITLRRTGRAPLTFTGELIAEVLGPREANRRHDLRIYQSDLGDYVVQVEYITSWQDEVNTSTVEVCADEGEIEAFFRRYDPTAHVLGYPATGGQMQAKQDRLLKEIRLRYDDQVSDLLEQQEIFAEPLQ